MLIPKQARHTSNRANNELEHIEKIYSTSGAEMSNFTEETAQIRGIDRPLPVFLYLYEIIIRSDELELDVLL